MEVKLNAREMAVVRELCKEMGLTELALMRQALRVYQSQHIDRQRGHETFTTGPEEIKCGCTYDVQKKRTQTKICMTHEHEIL